MVCTHCVIEGLTVYMYIYTRICLYVSVFVCVLNKCTSAPLTPPSIFTNSNKRFLYSLLQLASWRIQYDVPTQKYTLLANIPSGHPLNCTAEIYIIYWHYFWNMFQIENFNFWFHYEKVVNKNRKRSMLPSGIRFSYLDKTSY